MKKKIIALSCASALLVFVDCVLFGEETRYEGKGKRDPFVPLIGPDRAMIAGLEDIVSIDDVNLEGIAVSTQDKTVAIVNGEMLKEGERRGNLEVKKITKSMVTLIIGGKEYNLKLTEEGGFEGGR